MNKQTADAHVMVSRDGSRTITVEEFDRLFDEGSDQIDDFLDWDNGRRPGLVAKRVNVDFPTWMVQALDREASHRGITRQALIKMWLADKLDEYRRGRRPDAK
jgi:hypothetical protein